MEFRLVDVNGNLVEWPLTLVSDTTLAPATTTVCRTGRFTSESDIGVR